MNFIKAVVSRLIAVAKAIFTKSVALAVGPILQLVSGKYPTSSIGFYYNVIGVIARVVFVASLFFAVPAALVSFATTWLIYAAYFFVIFTTVEVLDIIFLQEAGIAYPSVV